MIPNPCEHPEVHITPNRGGESVQPKNSSQPAISNNPSAATSEPCTQSLRSSICKNTHRTSQPPPQEVKPTTHKLTTPHHTTPHSPFWRFSPNPQKKKHSPTPEPKTELLEFASHHLRLPYHSIVAKHSTVIYLEAAGTGF